MSKTKGILAGSFDPFHRGHLNLIERSKQFCDKLIIAIGINPSKQTLFTEEERIKQINNAIDTNVEFLASTDIEVKTFQGLLVDFAKEVGANLLIRGVRTVADFEYELTLANTNAVLSGIDTVFLPTKPHLSIVSSSLIKEVAKYGGDINQFTTPYVEEMLGKKFASFKIDNNPNVIRTFVEGVLPCSNPLPLSTELPLEVEPVEK